MNLDELHTMLLDYVGKRARITIVNGVGREATKAPGVIGTWREYPTINGRLVGGEYDNAARVEILGENGRYQVIA